MLRIRIEWNEPNGRAAPEINATMARLEIQSQELTLTEVRDFKAETIRPALYTPLYPIAEFIVLNWWSIFHECYTRRKPKFERRHNLRYAERGYPLPSVAIWSDGERLRFDLAARLLRFSSFSFSGSGSVSVPLADATTAISGFVESVVARLEASRIEGTLLQKEWTSLRNLTVDEASFCLEAGRLGLDPFDVDDALATDIVAAKRKLPTELWEEWSFAVTGSEIGESVEWFDRARSDLAANASFEPFSALTANLASVSSDVEPWKRGYDLATQVRRMLGLEPSQPVDLAQYATGATRDLPAARKPSAFEGLGLTKPGAFPILASTGARPTTARFRFARAMMDCLTNPREGFVLLTKAKSAYQQQGRAFAAELLAPAELLKQEIEGSVVDDETIDELADELTVSPFVIRHQIANHRIAQLFES